MSSVTIHFSDGKVQSLTINEACSAMAKCSSHEEASVAAKRIQSIIQILRSFVDNVSFFKADLNSMWRPR
jgi:activator of 2-hydroxyglutaryl-CoA dehydratase